MGILALVSAPAGAVEPSAGPSPPCGEATAWPRFPAPGAPPAVMSWRAADLEKAAWHPPACTEWPSSPSALVVALAGTFRSEGGTGALLARIGAISSMRDVRYWSTKDKAWRPMVLEAAALASTDPESRRPDFSPSDFAPGSVLHYWVNDYRTGPAVYRMRILEQREDRVVLARENVSPVSALFITLFAPGALQAVEFLERRGPDLWQAYLMTRIDQQGSPLVADQASSSINRVVAFYRRLADIPTDQEPPAAP